jgi:hypothetical protein
VVGEGELGVGRTQQGEKRFVVPFVPVVLVVASTPVAVTLVASFASLPAAAP